MRQSISQRTSRSPQTKIFTTEDIAAMEDDNIVQDHLAMDITPHKAEETKQESQTLRTKKGLHRLIRRALPRRPNGLFGQFRQASPE